MINTEYIDALNKKAREINAQREAEAKSEFLKDKNAGKFSGPEYSENYVESEFNEIETVDITERLRQIEYFKEAILDIENQIESEIFVLESELINAQKIEKEIA